MTNELTRPAPMMPAACDLRGHEWFPLHFNRLRKSKWWRRASDTARARNIMLWGEAFQQVPAGSLPNDDDELAEAAGYGMDVDAFLKSKDEIMGPWVLCSDGRWYHPTVCEMAYECWERLSDRRRKEREKKAARRAKSRDVPAAPENVPASSELVPRDDSEKSREKAPQDKTGQDTTGQENPSANADSADAACRIDPEALGGSDYGVDEDSQEDEEAEPASVFSSVPDDPRTPFERFWDAFPRKEAKGKAKLLFNKLAKTVDPDQIVRGAQEYREAVSGWPKSEWKYLPHPTTWLNSGRWEDDLTQARDRGEPQLGRDGERLRQVAVAQRALSDADDGAWE